MTDHTQTDDTAGRDDTLAVAAIEPASLHFDGDTLDRMTALGARASGVDIDFVPVPNGDPGLPDIVPVGIVHGDDPKVIALHSFAEAYRLRPARKKGTATALTVESFIDLVKRHKSAHSAIFADTNWQKPAFIAVIDYHERNDHDEFGQPAGHRGLADNGTHRIGYSFPLSEEWKAWTAADGKPMNQLEFAQFLEDRIAELSSPSDAEKAALERDFATTVATPAQLIQLSRGLQVHANTRVNNAVTLQSGEGQITWEEEHVSGDGKPLKVPGLFMLNIAPFFMGETVRIPVRLRYRVAAGALTWSFALYRPDQHITERVRDDLLRVGEQTGLPTYEGAPEV